MKRVVNPLIILVLIIAGIIVVAPDKAQAATVWAVGVAYHVGDEVTYQDATHPNHLYKCQQAHTSQSDWIPPVVPALWIDEGPVGSGPTVTPSRTPTFRPPTNTPRPGTPTPSRTPTRTPTTGPTTPPGSGVFAPYI